MKMMWMAGVLFLAAKINAAPIPTAVNLAAGSFEQKVLQGRTEQLLGLFTITVTGNGVNVVQSRCRLDINSAAGFEHVTNVKLVLYEKGTTDLTPPVSLTNGTGKLAIANFTNSFSLPPGTHTIGVLGDLDRQIAGGDTIACSINPMSWRCMDALTRSTVQSSPRKLVSCPTNTVSLSSPQRIGQLAVADGNRLYTINPYSGVAAIGLFNRNPTTNAVNYIWGFHFGGYELLAYDHSLASASLPGAVAVLLDGGMVYVVREDLRFPIFASFQLGLTSKALALHDNDLFVVDDTGMVHYRLNLPNDGIAERRDTLAFHNIMDIEFNPTEDALYLLDNDAGRINLWRVGYTTLGVLNDIQYTAVPDAQNLECIVGGVLVTTYREVQWYDRNPNGAGLLRICAIMPDKKPLEVQASFGGEAFIRTATDIQRWSYKGDALNYNGVAYQIPQGAVVGPFEVDRYFGEAVAPGTGYLVLNGKPHAVFSNNKP